MRNMALQCNPYLCGPYEFYVNGLYMTLHCNSYSCRVLYSDVLYDVTLQVILVLSDKFIV